MRLRPEKLALIAVLAGGFAIRLGAAQAQWRAFDREFPGVWDLSKSAFSQDGTQYVLQAGPECWKTRFFHDWARKAYYRPPLASYYFAALLPAVGFSRVAASAVQAALAVSAYALLFAMTRASWRGPVAWISLVAVLVHPVLIYYDSSFEDSALCLFLTAASLAVFQRAASGRAAGAAAGTLLGLAILSRPNVAVVFGCLLLLTLLESRDLPARVASFAAPVLLLTTLASLHNYRASGRWSFVTETSGENLFWGNNSRPEYRATLQGFWAIRDVDIGSPGFLLIDGLRRRYGETSIDGAFGAAALDDLVSSPRAAALGFGQKVLRHLAAYEIPRNENLEWLWERGMALRLPYPPYGAILVLAMAGAACLVRRSPRLVGSLLAAWLAVFVTEVLYFNTSRYRALAIPFLLPLAVQGAGAVLGAIRRREILSGMATTAAVAAALLVGARVVAPEEKARHRSASHFKAAMLELYPGDKGGGFRILDESRFARHIGQSLLLDPDNLEPFSIEQKRRIQEGRFDEALAAIRSRRIRCKSDGGLCHRTCNYLTDLALSSRSGRDGRAINGQERAGMQK